MRLLVDANLSPRVAARLVDAGHDARHVRDVGLLTASDEKIAAYAVTEGYIIVSADSDFATMLAWERPFRSLAGARAICRRIPARRSGRTLAGQSQYRRS